MPEMKCNLSHDREYATDCEECEQKDDRINVIERIIEIKKGDIDEK